MSDIKIKLTNDQIEQLESNGYDIDHFREEIESQPSFIVEMGAIDSLSDMHAIQQGGCESGAYVPAVTYYTAKKILLEHENEILELINLLHYTDEMTFDMQNETIGQFAVKIVSLAVDVWVGQFDLHGVDWN